MATLYRLWNQGHLLLYVGVTESLDRRLEEHAAGKPWYSEVASVSTEALPTMRLALEAEARAIFWEQPRYNILGSPRYSADWEARYHALEDDEAARRALPSLTEYDYRWLATTLNTLSEDGYADVSKRLYSILAMLFDRARA
jgi:predicted GIY-YIG superfamily endonuclease